MVGTEGLFALDRCSAKWVFLIAWNGWQTTYISLQMRWWGKWLGLSLGCFGEESQVIFPYSFTRRNDDPDA